MMGVAWKWSKILCANQLINSFSFLAWISAPSLPLLVISTFHVNFSSSSSTPRFLPLLYSTPLSSIPPFSPLPSPLPLPSSLFSTPLSSSLLILPSSLLVIFVLHVSFTWKRKVSRAIWRFYPMRVDPNCFVFRLKLGRQPISEFLDAFFTPCNPIPSLYHPYPRPKPSPVYSIQILSLYHPNS